MSVCGLVLAAGASRRAGPVDKLLATVQGQPMVRRVVETALTAGLDPVVVVTRSPAGPLEEALKGLPVSIARNGDASSGMASSLRRGLAEVPAGAGAAAVLLGDMPWVSPGTLVALVSALEESGGRSPCVPVCHGRRGNPVVWPSRFFPEMVSLDGDRGARSLLALHADAVREVAVEDEGVLRDVDTEEDLAELRRSDEPTSSWSDRLPEPKT